MSVSGTMAITRTELWAGSGQIAAQRGTNVWGANWLYSPAGIQNDLLVISEEFKNFSTSGAFMTDAEGATMSGGIMTHADVHIAAASGAAVATAVQAASGGAVAVSNAYALAASGGAVVEASGGAVAVAQAYANAISGAIGLNAELYAPDIYPEIGTSNLPSMLSGILDSCLVQNDIHARTSGLYDVGIANFPFSGVILKAWDNNNPMRLIVYSNGLVSGIAA